MPHTFTSQDFNREPSRAKRAASEGPVIITDRGEPAHVLLTIADYRQLKGQSRSLAQALSAPGLTHIDLEAELPAFSDLPRGAEFQ